MSLSFKTLAVLIFAAVPIIAERHTVILFDRFCPGRPTLILQNGSVIYDSSYSTDGPLIGATAFIFHVTGCGPEGEGCTAVKINLTNTGSNVGVSLAPPHRFSVPVSFRYNFCGRIGADCLNPDCLDASRGPSDTNGQVACNESDTAIAITFCGPPRNKLFVNG